MAEDQLSGGLLYYLASNLGTTEPALRLLLSVFFGYPLAIFHRNYLYGQKGLIQHLYFAITGFTIGYFNYGVDILHPVSGIIYTYLITLLLNGSLLSLQISFVANFGHLLLGYYFTETDDYDIKWTMPHCVLILRLIGYSFNIYDGTQPNEKLSVENQNTAIRAPPGFIEYCGFMFFPASFLVGPQFSYKRYEKFVNGEFRDSKKPDELPDCITPACRRLAQGVLYLALFQIGTIFFTETFIVSDEFDELSFLRKLVYLAFWAKAQLYKYLSCWMISEGALIMFSLSHNGKDENNVSKWNGCENIKISLFENATEFSSYIQSFNINTNQWVGQYIYKRLKFLGNRYISQFMALMFLAVWHGFHSGYYVCFMMEFLIVSFEKDFKAVIARYEKIGQFFAQPIPKLVLNIILRLYTFLFMGWCLAPFVLLKFSKYYQVFRSVYFCGYVFFLPWWLVYKPIVKLALGPAKKPTSETN